jgi:hypothetical protein
LAVLFCLRNIEGRLGGEVSMAGTGTGGACRRMFAEQSLREVAPVGLLGENASCTLLLLPPNASYLIISLLAGELMIAALHDKSSRMAHHYWR